MNIFFVLFDEDVYCCYLVLLCEIGCICEDGQVWWMIWLLFYVLILELCICDVCLCLVDVLSLVGLFRVLVGEVLGVDLCVLLVVCDVCLEENYWQVLCYGCVGCYFVEGCCVGVGDWLEMVW